MIDRATATDWPRTVAKEDLDDELTTVGFGRGAKPRCAAGGMTGVRRLGPGRFRPWMRSWWRTSSTSLPADVRKGPFLTFNVRIGPLILGGGPGESL
jgi:hypothetical protein